MSRRCMCSVKGIGYRASPKMTPLGGYTETPARHSCPRPCSGAVADREALRGALSRAELARIRTKPTEGHKGGTGKHAHPHPCSGAVACRETLRGVLSGAKPAEARTEPTLGHKEGHRGTARTTSSLLRGRSLPGGSQRGAGCGGPVGSKG